MRNADVVKSFIRGIAGKGSNLISTGNKLINYQTVIAFHEGGRVVLSSTKYSMTTSKIQNIVRREAYRIEERELGW